MGSPQPLLRREQEKEGISVRFGGGTFSQRGGGSGGGVGWRLFLLFPKTGCGSPLAIGAGEKVGVEGWESRMEGDRPVTTLLLQNPSYCCCCFFILAPALQLALAPSSGNLLNSSTQRSAL